MNVRSAAAAGAAASAGTAMLPASTRAAETRLAMTRRARAWVDFDTECSRGVERHGNVPGAIQRR